MGAVAGWGLGAATSALREREWLLAEYDGWLAIAGVLAIYGAAELLGAYGLAAFTVASRSAAASASASTTAPSTRRCQPPDSAPQQT